MVQLIVIAVLLMALSETAHAHFLWLERDGNGPARAYFGEWIDDIREKTGGLLDRFKAPRVFLGTSNEPLQVKRNENNLEDQQQKAAATCASWKVAFRRAKTKKKAAQRKRLLCQSRAIGNRREARFRAGADGSEQQYYCSSFSRRASAKGRDHDHRPFQMGKTFSHRRARAGDYADALGRTVCIGSHSLPREARRQRRGKVQSHASHLVAVVRATKRHSLDRQTLTILIDR